MKKQCKTSYSFASDFSYFASSIIFVDRRSLAVKTNFITSLAGFFSRHKRRRSKILRKVRTLQSESVGDAAISFSKLNEPSSSSSVAHQSRSCCNEETLAPARRRRFRVCFVVYFVLYLMLVTLVIERRKLVAVFMLLAFGFWLFELLLYYVSCFLRPCLEVKNKFDFDVGEGSKLDFDERKTVASIGEAETMSHLDVACPAEDVDQENEFVSHLEHGGIDCFDNSKKKKRKKNVFKTIVRIFRSKKDCRDGIAIVFNDVGKKEVHDDDKNSAGDVLRYLAPALFADHRRAREEDVQENTCRLKPNRYRQFEFFAVILLGLLGGKCLALVLTSSWFLFCKANIKDEVADK